MKKLTYLLCACVLFSGCAEQNDDTNELNHKSDSEANDVAVSLEYDYSKTSKNDDGPIKTAFAVVQAKSGSGVVGAVDFFVVDGGLRVVANVGGLRPGKHGFHIHEHGDCSAADASSAGGHFNPFNKKHGGPDTDERHEGDLGNLEANAYGFAYYDKVIRDLKLNGEQSIIGKSIVIHADEDDLTTDPTGNSGVRIGCGEIMSGELE